MAQMLTTTSGISNLNVAAMQSVINNIRARLATSKNIRAQDIQDLMWVYNSWIQHTHSVTDFYWTAYGNASAYSTTSVNGVTSTVLRPDQLTGKSFRILADFATPDSVIMWQVPPDMSELNAVVVGGGGGGGGSTTKPNWDSGPGAGGGSGYITTATIPVTPGEWLSIEVGAGGTQGTHGLYVSGGTGGRGGTSRIKRGNTVLAEALGGFGGGGARWWGGGSNWGSSGMPAAPGGIGLFNGQNGGAGNNDIEHSYQAGNGAGVGGPPKVNISGGDGLNGYVGAKQGTSRWQGSWLQNQGGGGGGWAGNGNAMFGGLGGGGGGGGLSRAGEVGGNGYIAFIIPIPPVAQADFPDFISGATINTELVRRFISIINAIKQHSHSITDTWY